MALAYVKGITKGPLFDDRWGLSQFSPHAARLERARELFSAARKSICCVLAGLLIAGSFIAFAHAYWTDWTATHSLVPTVALDRIAPPRKDRPVLFELPPVASAADAAKAAAALLEAVAVGDLTPAEASELGKLIEAYIKALEATDFAERLTKLEITNR